MNVYSLALHHVIPWIKCSHKGRNRLLDPISRDSWHLALRTWTTSEAESVAADTGQLACVDLEQILRKTN